MIEWSIGIVNYKSFVYLKHQIKGLYEFNSIPFKLIIVDNSVPSEEIELRELLNQYPNTELICHHPQTEGSSRQHTEGLNIIQKRVDTKYLLIQDPDFFWVRKDILKILQTKFEEGNVCVGAPFYRPQFTNDTTPALWGCAYLTSILEEGDFESFSVALSRDEVSRDLALGRDTGWKLRDKFKNQNLPTYSFVDKVGFPDWFPMKGKHTGAFNEKDSHEYFYEDRPIGYHLFHGSYDSDLEFASAKDQINITVPPTWAELRDQYAQHFYRSLQNDGLKYL